MITLDGLEVLTVEQVAERAEVAPKTFTSYLTKGNAPKADGAINARTPVWYPETIEKWLAGRPRKGRAKRT